MSTRATYRFFGHDGKPTLTFYIHHDGYPDGAAAYIANAALSECRGTMAEKFLRANERAEITHNHDRHADTDYRYDIDRGVVKGYRRRLDGSEGGWDCCYHGSMDDFINTYRAAAEKVCWFGNGIMTREKLEARVTAFLVEATRHSTSGAHGNATSCVTHAWYALLAILQAYGPSDFTARAQCAIDAFDEHHAKAFGWARMHDSQEAAVAAWKESFRKPVEVV